MRMESPHALHRLTGLHLQKRQVRDCECSGYVANMRRTVFLKPYIVSILPPGSVPSSHLDQHSTTDTSSNLSFVPTPVIEIRSSISLQPAQTLPVPFTTPPSVTATHIVRLLSTSHLAKSPLYLITTPTDRATATAEGSTVWQVAMKSWGEQVDELVEAESYSDALELLSTIDSVILPDKVGPSYRNKCVFRY